MCAMRLLNARPKPTMALESSRRLEETDFRNRVILVPRSS